MPDNSSAWAWSKRPGPQEASLIVVGDTNIQQREDPASAFVHVGATLRAADIAFGQLEGPLIPPSDDPLRPDIPHKDLWRHSDPRMVEGLVAAGFKGFSCASNVWYPGSVAGPSCDTLDRAGIAHCGAGRDIAAARRPALLEAKGIRFGFLSYTSVFWPVGHAATADTPGCATVKIHTGYSPGPRAVEMPGTPPVVITVPDATELAAMEADIRALRSRVDVVVTAFHWGISGSGEIAEYQQTVGRAAIEAGADLVYGQHPHIVQGAEFWNGKPIFYSLGNFAFDWIRMRGKYLDGIVLRAVAGRTGITDLVIVPVRRDPDNRVAFLDPTGEGEAIVRAFAERSARFGTTVEGRGAEVRLEASRAAAA